jgi:hypothetical protein
MARSPIRSLALGTLGIAHARGMAGAPFAARIQLAALARGEPG